MASLSGAAERHVNWHELVRAVALGAGDQFVREHGV
jgi:hypothetical protein